MNNRDQIRALVYERLQKPLQSHIAGLEQVVSDVQRTAEIRGILEKPAGIQPIQSTIPWFEDEVREAIWGLAFQGIIVPGVDSSATQASLPYFKVTEWGKKCLERGEYLPFDADQYIQRLRSEVNSIDPVVDLYLIESLNCFRCGSFVASAVMTGVAAEQLMLNLKGAIYNKLDSDEGKKRFENDSKDQIKRTYDAILKKLDPIREQMPGDLSESIGVELSGVFELIRRTRNSGGHPSGKHIAREEAEALLLLFPGYAKTVYSVIAWLPNCQM